MKQHCLSGIFFGFWHFTLERFHSIVLGWLLLLFGGGCKGLLLLVCVFVGVLLSDCVCFNVYMEWIYVCLCFALARVDFSHLARALPITSCKLTFSRSHVVEMLRVLYLRGYL